MRSEAETVEAYLAELPEDRRAAMEAVRSVILGNLPDGYTETMNWGMISYEIPLSVHADTYNGKPLMIAALASQKNHMAIYLCGLYCLPDLRAEFDTAYALSGKKPDLGASCLRFKRLDQLDLDAVAQVIAAVPPDSLIAASDAAPRKRKRRNS